MAKKHRKRCSISLVIWKMLIKITNTNTHPPERLNFKRPTILMILTRIWTNLRTLSGNTKLYSPIQKQFVTSYKIKHALTI